MCKQSKYIIFKSKFMPAPVVFAQALTHKEVALALCAGDLSKIKSAGFCKINEHGKYECFGESESLGIPADVDFDTRLLNTFLGTHQGNK